VRCDFESGIRAEAAKLRLILRRIRIESGFVFRGGEKVASAIVLALKFRASFDGPVLRKERNRVVALNRYALPVEIQ